MKNGEATPFWRRTFLGAFVASVVALFGLLIRRQERNLPGIRLRPPGALPEEEFVHACIGCMKCSNACPNGCIAHQGLSAGLSNAFTPIIHARTRGCILCGKCAEVCPTGALQPFEATEEGWLTSVDMGRARVNRDMCFSYHGRTCGACYRACPLPGKALRIGIFETPLLDPGQCVGCGLCEQACLHLPQAIRVIPTRRTAEGPRRGEPRELPLAPEGLPVGRFDPPDVDT